MLKNGKIMKFISALMPIGLIISVIYVTMNVVIFDYNSGIVKNINYSLTKVESVDVNENLHLSDGSEIKAEDIVGYIKVKHGTGTWFDTVNKYMIVEVLSSEMIYLYGVLLLYLIALTIALKGKFGFFERVVFRRVSLGIVIVAVCFSVLVFCLYVL